MKEGEREAEEGVERDDRGRGWEGEDAGKMEGRKGKNGGKGRGWEKGR